MNVKEIGSSDNFLKALLFTPKEYDENIPLIIYLHGAGERGKNLEHLYRHGVPKLIQSGRQIPAIVLCPQCPANFVWNNLVVQLKKFIDQVAEEYSILPDRISITGSSMGGFGTWEMGLTYPSFFSCIAPIAGGGLSWRCGRLINTPVIAFHGTSDTVVPFIYSKLMTDAVVKNGGHAELIALEGFEHNDGINEAYFNHNVIEWLIAKRRTDFDYIMDFCEELF